MTYKVLSDRLKQASKRLQDSADEFHSLDSAILDQVRAQAAALAALAESIAQFRHIDPLTPAQARVLTALRKYIDEHGHAPTQQELAEALGFESAAGVHQHLKRLDQRGVISLYGGPRGIRINKRGLK